MRTYHVFMLITKMTHDMHEMTHDMHEMFVNMLLLPSGPACMTFCKYGHRLVRGTCLHFIVARLLGFALAAC